MAGQRQFDEKQALGRAQEVFWLKGYGATSMQDLAAASGVQRGSLYNAYHDKETLFLRVFEGYADQVLAEAAEALAHRTVDQALHGFFDFTIASMTSGTPTRGCLPTQPAIAPRAEGERIRAALGDLLDNLERLLRERLSTDEARSRLTIPPAEAARVLITISRGIVVMERVYQDPARLRATAASLIAALLTPAERE
jgi:AcrR family transcriptional regulator